MSQPEFFDFDERLANLSKAGDPFEGLAQTVDFEISAGLGQGAEVFDLQKGSPAHDPVLMFSILILQALHSLLDQMELQIRDRLSFMRFLGLGPNIWCLMPKQFGYSASASKKRWSNVCLIVLTDARGMLALGGKLWTHQLWRLRVSGIPVRSPPAS